MNVEECMSDAWELQKYLECDLIPLHPLSHSRDSAVITLPSHLDGLAALQLLR